MVTAANASAVTARRWPEEWDLVVMHLLASGFVQLSQALEEGRTFPVPYPVSLQRGLDRLTAMCLVAERTPPRGVMDLAWWAHQPFKSWPLRPLVDGMGDDERLLIGGKPTKTCLEWAVVSGDVEGEIRERLLIHGVLDVCKAHSRPDVYTAFRRMLVERPAMSERDLALALTDPDLALVAPFVRSAYRSAPAEALAQGEAVVCGGCANLWVVDEHGQLRCHEWDCPNPVVEGLRLPAAEGVVWLSRELRMFVAGPGRVELRIARKLERAGLTVSLWPDFDACDVLPIEVPWAADVKSWLNPVRLAWQLTEHPFTPPPTADRGFIVIAAEQTTGRPEYLRALRAHCAWLKQQSSVQVVTENTYLRRVVQEARKGATP